MADEAAKRSDKTQIILEAALALLKEAGDAGLTMRKIAARADMRLSNVQYYYRSRDDVLKAMVERYFEECIEELRQLMRETPASTPREQAHLFILAGLRHGDELSDMCRIFRELWAISSRNKTINRHMADYYRTFASLIADFVLGEMAKQQARDRVASLLLPFFEGYSITSASVPVPTDTLADMLTDIVMSLAQGTAGEAWG